MVDIQGWVENNITWLNNCYILTGKKTETFHRESTGGLFIGSVNILQMVSLNIVGFLTFTSDLYSSLNGNNH